MRASLPDARLRGALMRSPWSSRRTLLTLGILIGLPPPLRAALPDGGPSSAGSLAGQLLIAAPDIGDPRFAHAVILVAVHKREEGALGITLNRPIGEKPLASLLRAVGEDAKDVAGHVRVFAGGPVQPDVGFIVHSAEYRRTGTIAIDEKVALTSSPEVLRDIAHGHGPKRSLIAFGYAGWAPGQLEAERGANAWFITPETPQLVFEEDRDTLWDKAMARRAIPL
jgi:putative transcriptional regulator